MSEIEQLLQEEAEARERLNAAYALEIGFQGYPGLLYELQKAKAELFDEKRGAYRDAVEMRVRAELLDCTAHSSVIPCVACFFEGTMADLVKRHKGCSPGNYCNLIEELATLPEEPRT